MDSLTTAIWRGSLTVELHSQTLPVYTARSCRNFFTTFLSNVAILSNRNKLKVLNVIAYAETYS